MKWIIEFTKHEGTKARTMPFKDELSARMASLAIVMSLAQFSTHDPDPQILVIPEDADLTEVKK